MPLECAWLIFSLIKTLMKAHWDLPTSLQLKRTLLEASALRVCCFLHFLTTSPCRLQVTDRSFLHSLGFVSNHTTDDKVGSVSVQLKHHNIIYKLVRNLYFAVHHISQSVSSSGSEMPTSCYVVVYLFLRTCRFLTPSNGRAPAPSPKLFKFLI